MHGKPVIVVLGDVNLDWVAAGQLPFRFSDLRQNGVLTWMALDELPGGSGLNFARFARLADWEPLLIGCVGPDTAGGFLRDWLAREGIGAALQTSGVHGTGRAFIARDPNDIRLLVNSAPNANADLDTSLVEDQSERIGACAALYISGYCVQDRASPRFRAAMRAMEIAEAAGSPAIVFDVVPHRIYDTYSFDEFRELTRDVDILISEVATMRRFFGLGAKSEDIDERLARETLERVGSHYKGCVLRYGPSGCDMELLWRVGADGPVLRATHHSQAADKRGFGDRLAIEALSGYFGVPPASRSHPRTVAD